MFLASFTWGGGGARVSGQSAPPSTTTKKKNENKIEMLAYQNVVGLQVGVYDAALAHVAERQEDLVSVGPRGVEVDADVVPKLLEHLAQVHVEVLERHAQVALVLEGALEPDDVLLVVRVGVVELLQDGDLGEAALPQRVVLPHDLDGHQLPRRDVDGAGDSRVHTAA